MITLLSYDQLSYFCTALAERLKDCNIVLLKGSMGVGKTTLVKHLLAHYAIHGPIVSPTYSYVIVYQATDRVVYHFDLYRLKSLAEFCSLGFEEYFADQKALIIIEWPEIIERFLEQCGKKYAIALEYYGNDMRLVTEQRLYCNTSTDST